MTKYRVRNVYISRVNNVRVNNVRVKGHLMINIAVLFFKTAKSHSLCRYSVIISFYKLRLKYWLDNLQSSYS